MASSLMGKNATLYELDRRIKGRAAANALQVRILWGWQRE